MVHNPSLTGIPPSVVRRLVENGALLVDVRTQCEFAGYHIEGSINIPYDELSRLRDFIRNFHKPVITFSTHGRRSEIACQKLRSMGVEVFNAGTIRRIETALNGDNEYTEFHHTF
jgi:phage shock protein E